MKPQIDRQPVEKILKYPFDKDQAERNSFYDYNIL